MAETRTNQPKRDQDSGSGASTTMPNRAEKNRDASSHGDADQKQTSGIQQPTTGSRPGRSANAGPSNPNQGQKPTTGNVDQDGSCGCASDEKTAADNGKNPTRDEE